MNIVALVNIERILEEVRNNIRGFYISVAVSYTHLTLPTKRIV